MATKSKAKAAKARSAKKSTTKASAGKAQNKRGPGKGKLRRDTPADGVRVQEETGVVGARAMDQKEAVALNSRHVAVRNSSESTIGPEGDRPESADKTLGETSYEDVYKKVVGEPGTLAKEVREAGAPKAKEAPKRESAKARTERERLNAAEAGIDGRERQRREGEKFEEKRTSVAKRVKNLVATDLIALLGRDSTIEVGERGVTIVRGMAGGNGRRAWQGPTLEDAVSTMLMELEVGPRQIAAGTVPGSTEPAR